MCIYTTEKVFLFFLKLLFLSVKQKVLIWYYSFWRRHFKLGFSTADWLRSRENTAMAPEVPIFPLSMSLSSEKSLLIPLILSRESGMQSRSVLISYNEQASRIPDSSSRSQIRLGTELIFPRETCHQVVSKFVFLWI